MAKLCPFTNDVVLYLDCKECDDANACRTLSLLGEESAQTNKKGTEEEEYEK